MGATLATVTPIMKEVYGPKIVDQLNEEVFTLTRIQKSKSGVTNEVGGKYVTFPIHITRNNGIGSRLEAEALPVPGSQGYDAARVGLKYGYGGMQLTGQSISLTDSNPKAFATALDEETTRLANDLKKDMNRQVYQDGSGTIGVVSTAGTSVNTATVSDARLFQINEIVDIITTPSTVAVQARTVTAINVSTGVVTLSGAAFSTTVGQIITRTGSGPSASGNRELTGFKASVSNTGTLFNIDPTVDTIWQAVNNNNAGTSRALSEGLMINVVDTIRTNGGTTTAIFTSLGVRRSYFNLLSQTRQTVNTQEFTGGFKGLAFTTDNPGDIPVLSDVDAPLNKMWFINEDDFTYYHDEDWHWLDRAGSMWQQVRDTNGVYDAWYAQMVEYHELGIKQRNSHGVLADITES